MLQSMPDIWDDQEFHTTPTAVLGELANWAVRQSPYVVPGNLSGALREFAATFVPKSECFPVSCKSLLALVRGAFEECPAILAWNNPKKGDHQIVFVSRHDSPAPDHDFIDLDALARNVAHAVTLGEKYSQAHDDAIDG